MNPQQKTQVSYTFLGPPGFCATLDSLGRLLGGRLLGKVLLRKEAASIITRSG